MLISYCLTAHKRTDDLLASFPSVIVAANQNPPVEIVIVDYGDQPLLAPILENAGKSLRPENSLIIKTYRKRKYYHMAHARNLSLRAATGEFIVITSTDILPIPDFFGIVRKRLAETGATYLRSMTSGYIGVITCKREEFIALGGYDERFEFYGPEDKDMLHRLTRHGAKEGFYDLDALISIIPTPDSMKVANYRLPLTKQEMSALGREVLIENDTRGIIVANKNIVWGEG